MSSQKVLVTGGTGLVGKAIEAIQSEFKEYEFIFCSSKDADLKDKQQTFELLSKYKPDIVIHLAANVGGLFKNLKQNVQMLEDNLVMNLNVIYCSYQLGIKKGIFCLSTCIFPDKITYPIDETMLHNGPPHNSNYGYAYSKRALETLCRAYNSQYNTKYTCVIPTNIYGEHDNFHLEDAHIIPALIHKALIASTDGTKFVVRGTGTPLRQFIYSKDLARCICHILTHLEHSNVEPIICSPVEEVSIGKIASLIASEFSLDCYFDDTYEDGQYKKTVSNTRLLDFFQRNNISFQFTSLEEGLKQTIKWFKETKDPKRM